MPGFPELCLAERPDDAQRWRRQYATDLIRADVLEFSRLHEINTMGMFVELLRQRVGSPLYLAPQYRSLVQALKVYFTDIGLVKGDAGVRFENAVAVMLHKHVYHLPECKLADSSPHRAMSRFARLLV